MGLSLQLFPSAVIGIQPLEKMMPPIRLFLYMYIKKKYELEWAIPLRSATSRGWFFINRNFSLGVHSGHRG